MATLTSATVQTSAVAGVNVQTFTGTLGGPPPPVISSTGTRPFSVDGDTFVGAGAALGRSCDKQHNACANAANGGDTSIGGVGTCDAQNQECRALISAKRRRAPLAPIPAVMPRVVDGRIKKRALDLGTCSDATILFENGLDGRNTPAFIAENQNDFNHGSALNIAVIAGFICQRLGSPCNAAADVQASCTSASAAAVATTQDQAAADVFNAIMGGEDVGSAATSTTAAAAATQTASECSIVAATTAAPDLASTTIDAVVMTITSCF
ncbi:hypothetical protein UCRPA7_6092 [Phaeoacremonium minimum UCRPA7]|uniref:Uncharacterized protein n=1 Tax=Phaeoacremonium minimum (strain UCR-PA7) TaxID=1286976 RepID=R8BGL9_PHAM7|nr:hypothetical protein UCRPA7_6092 [Phaeoacremonium minimum UCRPA7]EON98367.1 hypothetical protein UCRPA7_6092 [Phaeoacremonium minimum UCRPA7]